MTRRRLGVLLVFACLALVGGVVFAWWWRQPDAAVWAKVEARSENGKPFELARSWGVFSSHHPGEFTKTLSFDLSRYTGQLLRVDLNGGLDSGDGVPLAGTVGFSARLLGPQGERAIQFVGWSNEGKERLHHGPLGPTVYRGPTRDGTTFVTGKDGALWHVLRVQPGDRLELSYTPVLPGDLPRLDEPYIPPAPAPWQPASTAFPAGQRPDVFIFLQDAMRPDHMGCYGYPRPTTPTIDAFAETATVYEEAYSATSWTRASVASMLTGLYPLAHGVAYLDSDKLDEWPVTMAEALGAAGYDTAFFPINGQIADYWGFKQGFNHYAIGNHDRGTWAVAQAAALLEKADRSRPVFMYLHMVDPHVPYDPLPATRTLFDRGIPGKCDGSVAATDKVGFIHPKLTPTDVQHLIDLYDGDIRDGDTAFAQFLVLLKRSGRLENSLIIVVADHGEAFTEHDTFMHGRTLNAEDLHVPLILHYPHGRYAGVRVQERVNLVDLYPTIMAATGARPNLPYGLPGRDLATLSHAGARRASRPIFAELSNHQGDHLDLVSVLDDDGYKRVIDLSVPPDKAAKRSVGMWDTKTDPREQVDLTGKLPVRAAYDEQLLAEYLTAQRWWRGSASTNSTATAPITEAMRKRLRDLGYVK